MGWREQQQAVLEVCGTKDYRIPHLRFDAHACCFIDEESGKAWDEGKAWEELVSEAKCFLKGHLR